MYMCVCMCMSCDCKCRTRRRDEFLVHERRTTDAWRRWATQRVVLFVFFVVVFLNCGLSFSFYTYSLSPSPTFVSSLLHRSFRRNRRRRREERKGRRRGNRVTQGQERRKAIAFALCVRMQLSAERIICQEECLEARDIALGPEVQVRLRSRRYQFMNEWKKLASHSTSATTHNRLSFSLTPDKLLACCYSHN